MLIIDHFNCRYAICKTENGREYDIEKELLPDGVKPGDVIFIGKDEFNTRRLEKERWESCRMDSLFKK